jgi:hypothetical protein
MYLCVYLFIPNISLSIWLQQIRHCNYVLERINRNQTFIWDFHLPFICSVVSSLRFTTANHRPLKMGSTNDDMSYALTVLESLSFQSFNTNTNHRDGKTSIHISVIFAPLLYWKENRFFGGGWGLSNLHPKWRDEGWGNFLPMEYSIWIKNWLRLTYYESTGRYFNNS